MGPGSRLGGRSYASSRWEKRLGGKGEEGKLVDQEAPKPLVDQEAPKPFVGKFDPPVGVIRVGGLGLWSLLGSTVSSTL